MVNNDTNLTIYIFPPSDSPGLMQDAMLYQKYIQNSLITTRVSEIRAKSYALILLEHIPNNLPESILRRSQRNIMMVNIDLFWADAPKLVYIHMYLCKTQFTKACLKRLMDERKLSTQELLYTKHTSFHPTGLYNPDIQKNYKCFLHTAGKSRFKNTRLVVQTWLRYSLPTLYVTCYQSCLKRELEKHWTKEHLKGANVVLLDQPVSNDKLCHLKNYCGVHICPSLREGYGHYINEARMVKAVVVTVDGAPMNELIDQASGFLVPCHVVKENKFNHSLSYGFTCEDLFGILQTVLSTEQEKLRKKGEVAYQNYVKDTQFFKEQITALHTLVAPDTWVKSFRSS